jgi:pimeloyl-ACP methyl ester carboxylesterase
MSAGNRAIARACVERGLAVVAIDGPVHGDRRADKSLDPTRAVQSYREAWKAGIGRTSMAEEMSAALDAVLAMDGFQRLPIGYIGVSMGTGYGIPFLAMEPRVVAAAIGLWGMSYPASDHLWEYARGVNCAVWFTQQWDDPKFERSSTFDLFNEIAARDKRLVAYPGGHLELEGERLEDAIDFLVRRLSAVIGRPVPALAVTPSPANHAQ